MRSAGYELSLDDGGSFGVASVDITGIAISRGAVGEGRMPKANAFSNNDVVFLAWGYEHKIENCLGFAIERIDIKSGKREFLPAWVGFAGDEGGRDADTSWRSKPTSEWPVQKFNWKDVTARRGASYRYRITPMVGQPGALEAASTQSVETNPVHVSPECGNISAYFNRGILATQHVAHAVGGRTGNARKLLDRIVRPGDPLRESLTGQLQSALLSLLERAKSDGGEIYCALYELTDPVLLQALLSLKKRVHIVLSNAGDSEDSDKTNAASREALKDARIDITDRMMPSGHIGHNKFVVYVNTDGEPSAVLTGSTNWTSTGLCAQTNNALVIEDAELAKAYLAYWHELRDTSKKGEGKAAIQPESLRTSNGSPRTSQLPPSKEDEERVSLWFSPNTPHARSKKHEGESRPNDLSEVFAAIAQAKEAIFFLAFQPGTPSIIDAVAEAQKANPKLIVRGAVTAPVAAKQFRTDLYHGDATKADVSFEDEVVAAAAIDEEFGVWWKELLSAGHAIIHDKIVVIDPLSDDGAVVTGSHNLGYQASYNNDENMIIVRGNHALRNAYLTHVQDVYDHYRWRNRVHEQRSAAWAGLDSTPGWQDKYFKHDSWSARERAFWLASDA